MFHHYTIPLHDPSITPEQAASTREFIKGRDEAACLLDLDYGRRQLFEKFLEADISDSDFKDHARYLCRFFAHPDKESRAFAIHYARDMMYYAALNPHFVSKLSGNTTGGAK